MRSEEQPRGAAAASAGIVIVGGGFAGMEVAKALDGSPVPVVLIDRYNYTLFQPLLYQVATAALSPTDVAVPIRSLLHGRNTAMLLDEVIRVDLERSQVVTAAGRRIGFGTLVLATGSRYNYFGREEWAHAAPALKSLDDALAIRRRLLLAFEEAEMCGDEAERLALMTFVVVGAGPTGVEMAGAIAELARASLRRDFRHIDPAAARILLIEGGPRVLPEFPERLGRYAERALARLGVEILLGSKVDEIDAAGVDAAGRRIASRNVIWAAGVKASPVARWLHIDGDRRGAIAVNPDFSVPGHPEIFVIGDAARVRGPSGAALPGLAAVAKQEGEFLGQLLRRRLSGGAAMPAFRYRDYGMMATIGRSAAVADLHGLRLTGTLAWLLWGLVHLYFLIGFRNRVLVLTNWLWAWLTYKRGARLITGERPPAASKPASSKREGDVR